MVASHERVFDVRLSDSGCQPAHLRLRVGDTVRWRAMSHLAHVLQLCDASDGTVTLETSLLERGQQFQHTFERAQELTVACAIHPRIRGAISVGAATRECERTAPLSELTQDRSKRVCAPLKAAYRGAGCRPRSSPAGGEELQNYLSNAAAPPPARGAVETKRAPGGEPAHSPPLPSTLCSAPANEQLLALRAEMEAAAKVESLDRAALRANFIALELEGLDDDDDDAEADAAAESGDAEQRELEAEDEDEVLARQIAALRQRATAAVEGELARARPPSLALAKGSGAPRSPSAFPPHQPSACGGSTPPLRADANAHARDGSSNKAELLEPGTVDKIWSVLAARSGRGCGCGKSAASPTAAARPGEQPSPTMGMGPSGSASHCTPEAAPQLEAACGLEPIGSAPPRAANGGGGSFSACGTARRMPLAGVADEIFDVDDEDEVEAESAAAETLADLRDTMHGRCDRSEQATACGAGRDAPSHADDGGEVDPSPAPPHCARVNDERPHATAAKKDAPGGPALPMSDWFQRPEALELESFFGQLSEQSPAVDASRARGRQAAPQDAAEDAASSPQQTVALSAVRTGAELADQLITAAAAHYESQRLIQELDEIPSCAQAAQLIQEADEEPMEQRATPASADPLVPQGFVGVHWPEESAVHSTTCTCQLCDEVDQGDLVCAPTDEASGGGQTKKRKKKRRPKAKSKPLAVQASLEVEEVPQLDTEEGIPAAGVAVEESLRLMPVGEDEAEAQPFTSERSDAVAEVAEQECSLTVEDDIDELGGAMHAAAVGENALTEEPSHEHTVLASQEGGEAELSEGIELALVAAEPQAASRSISRETATSARSSSSSPPPLEYVEATDVLEEEDGLIDAWALANQASPADDGLWTTVQRKGRKPKDVQPCAQPVEASAVPQGSSAAPVRAPKAAWVSDRYTAVAAASTTPALPAADLDPALSSALPSAAAASSSHPPVSSPMRVRSAAVLIQRVGRGHRSRMMLRTQLSVDRPTVGAQAPSSSEHKDVLPSSTTSAETLSSPEVTAGVDGPCHPAVATEVAVLPVTKNEARREHTKKVRKKRSTNPKIDPSLGMMHQVDAIAPSASEEPSLAKALLPEVSEGAVAAQADRHEAVIATQSATVGGACERATSTLSPSARGESCASSSASSMCGTDSALVTSYTTSRSDRLGVGAASEGPMLSGECEEKVETTLDATRSLKQPPHTPSTVTVEERCSEALPQSHSVDASATCTSADSTMLTTRRKARTLKLKRHPRLKASERDALSAELPGQNVKPSCPEQPGSSHDGDGGGPGANSSAPHLCDVDLLPLACAACAMELLSAWRYCPMCGLCRSLVASKMEKPNRNSSPQELQATLLVPACSENMSTGDVQDEVQSDTPTEPKSAGADVQKSLDPPTRTVTVPQNVRAEAAATLETWYEEWSCDEDDEGLSWVEQALEEESLICSQDEALALELEWFGELKAGEVEQYAFAQQQQQMMIHEQVGHMLSAYPESQTDGSGWWRVAAGWWWHVDSDGTVWYADDERRCVQILQNDVASSIAVHNKAADGFRAEMKDEVHPSKVDYVRGAKSGFALADAEASLRHRWSLVPSSLLLGTCALYTEHGLRHGSSALQTFMDTLRKT
ncbi:hypothetical protein AB1Y20_020972 [Prymnesium parvum]|uniref:Uncharacterized protein n=1 Tax=Prymnesium parvum TaxID=97485 RepID=A0AB34JJZ3_PRYPA